MAGLKVPDKKYVGRFRGEPGLETMRVWVDGHEGALPERVASELAACRVGSNPSVRQRKRPDGANLG